MLLVLGGLEVVNSARAKLIEHHLIEVVTFQGDRFVLKLLGLVEQFI